MKKIIFIALGFIIGLVFTIKIQPLKVEGIKYMPREVVDEER